METLHISQVEENVYALNEVGKTVMYLIIGQQRALLLDTGFGLRPLAPVLQEKIGEKPLYVVNSHSHVDHNSGNNQFPLVYVGWMDEPMAHQTLTRADIERNRDFFLLPAIERGYRLEEWHPGPAKEIEPVREGHVFDLGGIRLQVLETPGHTIGSICLWEEEKGWLFTGDLMLTWEVWGQLSSSSCLRYYAESLEKLAALPGVRWIFPAHAATVDSDDPDTIRLPREVVDIYAEGTRRIVEGKDRGETYECGVRSGRCVKCAVGGMAFDPDRL